jgi:hypothetical protein
VVRWDKGTTMIAGDYIFSKERNDHLLTATFEEYFREY